MTHGGAKNMAGQRFGMLVAIAPTNERRHGQIVWRFQCDCGREKTIAGACVRNGSVLSCGCLQRLRAAKTLIRVNGYEKLFDNEDDEGVEW